MQILTKKSNVGYNLLVILFTNQKKEAINAKE